MRLQRSDSKLIQSRRNRKPGLIRRRDGSQIAHTRVLMARVVSSFAVLSSAHFPYENASQHMSRHGMMG
jgi:hypothetical protein